MACAMTEAIKPYFTPVLIFCSTQDDQSEMAKNLINQQFGSAPAEQLSWINVDREALTIEMVRNLTQDMSYASFQGQVRHVILLAADQATLEAQNALLKLLEEPPSQTQLWLIATQPTKLLPTVKSRCQELFLNASSNTTSSNAEVSSLASSLSKLSHRELSELAEKFSEREDAKKIVTLLIHYFHTQPQLSDAFHNQHAIKSLLESMKYLDANVNVRMTLEHCFFTIKQVLQSQTK